MTPAEPLTHDAYPTLSERQRRALPIVLAAPTLKAGLDAAEVPRSTWHRWREEAEFESTYRRLQRGVIEEAMADLRGGTRFAVSSLFSLLTSKNEQVKLQASRDVLTFAFKALELGELTDRIERLENALAPLLADADA